MFEEKTIFRFNPFYFKDGSPAKPKYFIVLKNIDGQTIVANLPSSKIHIPFPEDNVRHGCIDLSEYSICCYCFKAHQIITDEGWAFPKDTFLYGRWVDEFDLQILSETYTQESIDYKIEGKLTDTAFNDVLNCLYGSSQLKRKYKKMIGSWLNKF